MVHNILGLAIALAILVLAFCMPAKAQNGFWDNYYAAQNGYNSGFQNSIAAQQLRASEAMINLERRRQGLPPCSIGLLGQWQGKPAC